MILCSKILCNNAAFFKLADLPQTPSNPKHLTASGLKDSQQTT